MLADCRLLGPAELCRPAQTGVEDGLSAKKSPAGQRRAMGPVTPLTVRRARRLGVPLALSAGGDV